MSRNLVCYAILAAVLAACGSPRTHDSPDRVKIDRDAQGKISQLTVDAKKDGKPNIYSHMNGTKFVLIEIDKDEDGKIDRWEYYGTDQKIEKVGLSRANNGKPDYWVYAGSDGAVNRIELATKGNGVANRTEYYEKGSLSRADEDTDGDGRIDKWETYSEGALATVGFDTRHSGSPDRIIDYRKER